MDSLFVFLNMFILLVNTMIFVCSLKLYTEYVKDKLASKREQDKLEGWKV